MAEVQLTILAELQLGTNPTPAQLMRTALSLVKEMAVFNGLSVEQKEAVAVHVLEKSIQKTLIPDSEKSLLIQLCKTVIPETLKIALEISNGDFSLKHIPTTKAGCWTMCSKGVAILKSDPHLLAIAQKKLAPVVATVEAVEVKVETVSEAVKITDLSGSIKEVILQELAKTPVTDVSGIQVSQEAAPQTTVLEEAAPQTTVLEEAAPQTAQEKAVTAPLTPEQAASPGLFLDWATSSQNNPSVQTT